MNFTQGQNSALTAIQDLKTTHPNGGGILVINGYAGTGKTTLIKAVGDQVEGQLLVLAPTGKAAIRVRDVAFCKTSTIHKWLYHTEEDKITGDISFKRADLIEIEVPNFHALIIDEASMIGEDIWNDLYDVCCLLGLNVVLIGDEFQLPPVETGTNNFSVFTTEFEVSARVNLTEVLRQSLENPIIRAATALRLGTNYTRELSLLPLIDKLNVVDESVDTWSNDGVIICHKNDTRHILNNEIRKTVGRINTLEPKEPLLVIKNNYNLHMFNGEVFGVKSIIGSVGSKMVKDKFKNASCYVNFSKIVLSTGEECIIALEQLSNKTGDVGFKTLEAAAKQVLRKANLETTPFLHVNYGYVMTCHKSQGSEWDNALVIVEQGVKPVTLAGRRWLYTALTRSKRHIKLCWY